MNKCPLCKSKNSELIYTNSRGDIYLENYVCDNCGFVYTYPRISNDEIERLYLKGDFSKQARKSSEPDLNKFIQTETWALERFHLLEQKLPQFFSSKKTCLEIGCGTGSFLWLLQNRGHVVKGIEPDSKFVNAAIDRYNIDVDSVLFENFNDIHLYDFICNFHVIEHVLNPRSFIKNIYAKLKDDGYVYIECPTIDDIYTKNLDTFFWDVHVNTFSNQNLPWLLESEGFTVNEVFMNRGFVAVVAKKGNENNYVQDSKERILDLINVFKAEQDKKNRKRSYKNRIKGRLKNILNFK
jgi:SAM-dependent methyltransferase